MTNVLEICKSLGIDVPEDKSAELTKAVAENYVTKAEHDKKIAKAELERDTFKEQYETASNTLKGFEGVDVTDLQNQVANWKAEAEKKETEYNQKLYQRDFDDAMKTAIEGVKFSSSYAKTAIIDEIKKADLKLVNGSILGFNDLMEQLKEKDPTAFVTEEGEGGKKPHFAPNSSSTPSGNPGTKKLNEMSIDERIALKQKDPELYASMKHQK